MQKEIPLDGINIQAESYMKRTDFLKAKKKEGLLRKALKRCHFNFQKVGDQVKILMHRDPKPAKEHPIFAEKLNLSSDSEEGEDEIYVCHRCYRVYQ